MSRVYPTFYIKSYDEALPFYIDFLGFKIDFEWRHQPGFPVYMGVSRGASPGITKGELAIHLTEHKVPEGTGIRADVEDVHAFFDDLKSRDARMLEASITTHHGLELVDQPWEKTELHLVDPFKNGLIFTSKTTTP